MLARVLSSIMRKLRRSVRTRSLRPRKDGELWLACWSGLQRRKEGPGLCKKRRAPTQPQAFTGTKRACPKEPMILTQCAVCATELGLSLGKKCGPAARATAGPNARCSTGRGRPTSSQRIKKAGGAEQFHANQKYTEPAVASGGVQRTRRARRATSARRPSTGKRRRASCAVCAPRTAGVAHARSGGAGEFCWTRPRRTI